MKKEKRKRNLKLNKIIISNVIASFIVGVLVGFVSNVAIGYIVFVVYFQVGFYGSVIIEKLDYNKKLLLYSIKMKRGRK